MPARGRCSLDERGICYSCPLTDDSVSGMQLVQASVTAREAMQVAVTATFNKMREIFLNKNTGPGK
jgi:hypothetical protein